MNLLHQWLQTAVSLGLDSLVAGLAVGWILPGLRGPVCFALGCGLCDGIASWAGAAVPHQLPDCFDAGLYLVCVGLLLAGAVRTRAWLYAMPVVLSIDNLAAGVSADQAPLLALSSAVMAGAGLTLASLGRISVPWLLRLRKVRDACAASHGGPTYRAAPHCYHQGQRSTVPQFANIRAHAIESAVGGTG